MDSFYPNPCWSSMSKSSGDLPNEMVREILVRLAVKSLLRCKSVCKPWLSLISNPHFINSHLHHTLIASRKNPTLLLLQHQEEEWVQDNEPLQERFNCLLVPAERQMQLRFQRLFEALVYVNSQELSTFPITIYRISFGWDHVVSGTCCNGILCVADGFDTIYLWNPSIRQCKILASHGPDEENESVLIDLVFGYDPVSDDYKVFKFFCEVFYSDRVPILQVYSLNADSWIEFRPPILESLMDCYRAAVFINGVLYLNALDNLVSFDLRKQDFVHIPFPTSIQRNKSNVLDFKGSVAIVFESSSGVDLWTLDDVSGEVSSWTRRFSLEDAPKFNMWFFSYLGAGLFYGKKTFNGILYDFFYDYEKKETTYYQLGEDKMSVTLNYTETLVSLDGFEPVGNYAFTPIPLGGVERVR